MRPALYPSTYITTTGVLQEKISPQAYKALLPNGKESLAFLEKKAAHLQDKLFIGARVELRICPADFDCARIDALLKEQDLPQPECASQVS